MTNTGLFIIRLQEVADILNVSTNYVRRLSANGELPFHGHPEYYRLQDVLAYKEVRDIDRRKGFKELAALTQEYGGYGFEDYDVYQRAADELTQHSQDLGLYGGIDEDRERLLDDVRD